MALSVLQCITHPRSQQHMNNVKKLCVSTVQYADQLQRNLEGNHFNQWRTKREHSSGILIICHRKMVFLLSLSLPLTHSLSFPLFHCDSGLRQATEILRLVGIKRLSVKKCKKQEGAPRG